MNPDTKLPVSDRSAGEFQARRNANRPSCLALAIALPVLALGARGYKEPASPFTRTTADHTGRPS
jgi:hypothetical protein